jgi:hypothetical protein
MRTATLERSVTEVNYSLRTRTSARRRRKSNPAVSDARPSTKYAGRGLAVLGAIAPFENVVVELLADGAALGAAGGADVAFAAAIVVSLALASCVLVPAAESTHVFMSVSRIRATLSDLTLASATVGLAVSTTALRAGGTKLVNWADSAAGAIRAAPEKKTAIVTWRKFTGNLRIIAPFRGIGRARLLPRVIRMLLLAWPGP